MSGHVMTHGQELLGVKRCITGSGLQRGLRRLGAWCVRDPRRRGVWHVAAPVPDGALCAEPLGDADRRAVEGHAEEAAARVGEALGMPRGKPPWVA